MKKSRGKVEQQSGSSFLDRVVVVAWSGASKNRPEAEAAASLWPSSEFEPAAVENYANFPKHTHEQRQQFFMKSGR